MARWVLERYWDCWSEALDGIDGHWALRGIRGRNEGFEALCLAPLRWVATGNSWFAASAAGRGVVPAQFDSDVQVLMTFLFQDFYSVPMGCHMGRTA